MADTNEYLRVNAEGVRSILVKLFVKDGIPESNARIIADNLITADLRGVSSHGVARIKSYLERAKKENWKADPQITFEECGAVCTVDGDDGFGSVVGSKAMEKAIELAKVHGIGLCAVRRSSHYGMASYYSLKAAKQGFIGFSCTNGVSNLAHFGSMEGFLGTNPFSMAIPTGTDAPLVLDVACSVTARGNISNAKREGQAIPLGWAIDEEGNPTTDAAAALKGAVLPFAGHKGSGIAIMIDILCGILNSGVTSKHVREDKTKGPEVGHMMIAIDPKAFGSEEEFAQRLAAYQEELKAAKKAPGFEKIYLPGEIEAEKEAFNKANGIKMGKGAFRELCEACAEFGVDEDPNKYLM